MLAEADTLAHPDMSSFCLGEIASLLPPIWREVYACKTPATHVSWGENRQDPVAFEGSSIGDECNAWLSSIFNPAEDTALSLERRLGPKQATALRPYCDSTEPGEDSR
ncbi:uncharacterized protein N7482_006503 [Penicillium canariense]|uniref:Uncharacterized protein n=1 Tax=Penicillium canariense TaxID=189055 RepID=A0A9W9LJ80_9EURO|nr:uncharacterized protein N7482_006503 [Penicillium canariense]KAJ5159499.1 hypothetical protein N7482_006503 [Penicillium canariense]